MNIRTANYKDAPAIRQLLEALGYKTTISLLITQLEKLHGQKDHEIVVCELDKEIRGFISVHYLPQLGFDGELAIITYLSVEEGINNMGIGKELEQYVVIQALKRKCDRIQVQCMDWRTREHAFFEQQGYREYPKYYTKRLVYAE